MPNVDELTALLREERVSLWSDLGCTVRGSMQWDWVIERIQAISRLLGEPTDWKQVQWSVLDVYEAVESGAGVEPQRVDWSVVERLKASLNP